MIDPKLSLAQCALRRVMDQSRKNWLARHSVRALLEDLQDYGTGPGTGRIARSAWSVSDAKLACSSVDVWIASSLRSSQ